MLRKGFAFMVFAAVCWYTGFGQTKNPGTYRSGIQDGAALSAVSFTVSNIMGDTVVCAGNEVSWRVKVTGSSVYRYRWVKQDSPSTVSDTSVLVINGAAQVDEADYYCEVTDLISDSTKRSNTIHLRVVGMPTVSITPSLDRVAEGAEVRLTAAGAESYRWNTGASTNELIVYPRQTTTYSVTGINGGICREVKSKTIEVIRVMVDAGKNRYISEGNSVELRVNTNISNIVWYKYLSDGSRVRIGTGISVTDSPSESTRYEAEGEFNGFMTSSFVEVFVKSAEVYRSGVQDGYAESEISFTLGKITGDTLICKGGTTTFSVKVKGTSVYGYQWMKTVGAITDSVGRDTSVLLIDPVDNSTVGEYYCIVTDLRSDSPKTSESVRLQAIPYPVACIGSPEDDTVLCYGNSVDLDAWASEPEHFAGYEYKWLGVSGRNDTAVINVSPTSSRDYVVAVSNRQCTSYDTVGVVVYRPQVDIPPTYYVAEGAMLSINATTSDPAALVWCIRTEGTENYDSQLSSEPFVWGPVTEKCMLYVRMNNNGCPAEDSCQILMKSGGSYRSGRQDGYAQSCLRPHIIDQTDRNIAGCAEDSVVLFVEAEGSSLNYTWKKMVDHRFEEYRPSPNSSVTGLGTAVLKFNPPVPEDEGLYICLVSNECGEQVSDTFGVSVGGRPVFVTNLNRDWEQCLFGHPAELAVYVASLTNTLLTYKWYKDGQLLAGPEYEGPGITVGMESESAEGLYKVEVSNDCGTVTDSTFLPVDVPAYVSSNDTVLHVCENGTAEFKAEIGGGGTYTCSLKKVEFSSSNPLGYILQDMGYTGQQVRIPNMDISHDGEYYAWVVENHCGADTSHFIRLVIEEKPEIEMLGGDTTVCAGEQLSFGVRLTAGTGNINYAWYRNGIKIGYTGQRFTKTMAPEDSGVYTCFADNSYCLPAVQSAPREIKVNDKAAISVKGIYVESEVINSDGKYCEGTALKLKADVLATPPADSVRWYLNGVPVEDRAPRITGCRTAVLAIDSVTPAEEGVYTLHLYNSCGENIQGNFRLSVPQPARFVREGGNLVDMTLCQGVNQAISVQTTGTAPIRFTWTHDGRTVADGYSNTLQLNDVTVDTAGEYCCEIHNGCNPAQRECAEIRVTHPDTFSLVGSSRYCMDDINGATIVLRGSDTSALYRLYKNNVEVAAIHGKNVVPQGGPVVFTGNLAGTYYVTGEDDENHCEYRMPGEVTIQGDVAPLKYNLTLSHSYCEGDAGGELTLSGSEDDPDILYTLYRMTAFDQEAIRMGRTGNGDTLVWPELPEGNYKVVARNRVTGCETTMQEIVNVTKRGLPAVPLLKAVNRDTVYCAGAGSDVSLYVESPEANTSYVLLNNHHRPGSVTTTSIWNAVEQGIYTAYAVNIWGCESVEGNTVKVIEQTVRRPELTGSDVFCEGDGALHRIEINGLQDSLDYVIYEESPRMESEHFSGINGSHWWNVPSVEKIYYVEARDRTPEHCSVLSDTVTIRKSRLTANTVSPVIIANGEQAVLTVEVSGAAHPVFEWQPAGKTDGLNNQQSVTTLPLQSGETFEVKVTENGCEVRASVQVVVRGNPLQVDIKKEDQRTSVDTVWLCALDSLTLYGSYDGGNGQYVTCWYEGGDTISKEMWLRNYPKRTEGYIYYEVSSGSITEKDSVYVRLLPAAHLPAEFALEYSACTEAGNGWIRLNGLSASQEYIIRSTSLQDSVVISGLSGRDTLRNLPWGEYCLTVRDRDLECPAPDSCVAIRESAPSDNITGDFAYCGADYGVALHLSGVTPRTMYTLCGADTTELETLSPGESVFNGPYREGRYVLKKQRQGAFPGCVAYDTLRVEHRPDPLSALEVEVDGALCTSDSLTVSLPYSQDGVAYILQKVNGMTMVSLDTINGNENRIQFTKRKFTSGFYRVYAAYEREGCGVAIDTILRVSDGPEDVLFQDCNDCISAGISTGGCRIRATGLQRDVRYVLYKSSGEVLDTLYGPGSGGFVPQTAGSYYVIAEDVETGCLARMTHDPVIGNKSAPFPCPVEPFCAEEASVRVWGSEGDTVKYTLYRDNVCLTEDTLRGTGMLLDFGVKSVPGIYKVWAEKENGCGIWLPDSVVLYNRLGNCELRQEGDFCSGGNSGVSIRYDCSVVGWNYYLTRSADSSRILAGNMHTIFWDTVGGSPLLEGIYALHARNACKDTVLKSITVNFDSRPLAQDLLGEDVFCNNEGFDIRLSDSEAGVIYRLVLVLTNGQEVELGNASGTGQPLQILPAGGGRFLTPGRYRVYGKFVGSDCEVLVAEKVFQAGAAPELIRLQGRDVCMQQGNDSLELSISRRETGMNYYLQMLPSILLSVKDSLTDTYKPAPEVKFAVQRTEGCYGAYAVNPANGCRTQLEGTYCMGMPPADYPLTDSGDTVHLCKGESYRLHLSGSDAGVKYYLLQNGQAIGGPYWGPGEIVTDSVFQDGVYRIKAENGCELVMSGSVVVKVNPLPPLRVAPVRYCEGGDGKQIALNAPTSSSAEYRLFLPDGRIAERLQGTGMNLIFTDKQTEAGYYPVTGRDVNTNCESRDSVLMIVDSLPLPFLLSGEPNGEYICPEEEASLVLDGSQEGVRYVLYRNDVQAGEKFGTGNTLTFGGIREPGTYKVEGIFTNSMACRQVMANILTMVQAGNIERFVLSGEKTSYCYTDPEKARLRLNGSETGIEYELYKDGQPTGLKQNGSGGPLIWAGLEGKPCGECRNEADGYEYYVVGRDLISGCEMPMRGSYKIIEESEVNIEYFHPNKDIYVCQDSAVDFTVIADGCRLNYRWYQQDGANVVRLLQNGPEAYYKIEAASGLDYGKYWCEVSNSCATVGQTGAVEVKVRRRMEVKPDREVLVCDGAVQTVRLEAIYYGTDYKWYKAGDTTLLGTEQVLVLPDVTSGQGGKYVCIASNECYTLTDTCVLRVGLPPALEIVSAETDTLCRGSFYEMRVSSTDTVKWYRNGLFTGVVGNTYTIPAVELADEGHYSVKTVSACAERWTDLSDLYVDDTIRVLDITPDSLILCAGRMLDLYVVTQPSERVNYRWEYVGGGVQEIGREAHIQYGPMGASNTAYTFRVWYSNKCPLWDLSDPSRPANYRQLRIQVNDKAGVEDPDREIIVCADPSRDTVIRIRHDNRLGMLYNWYFFDYRNDTVPELSNADTVKVPLSTRSSGYYFCRVNNGCEIIATNACWLQVDSIPVIKGNLPASDTLCEGEKLELGLEATGGSLNYDWMILYKDGRTEELPRDYKAEYESRGELPPLLLTMAYDSARICCHVWNHCDETGSYSDTLLLRVRPWREVSVSPDTLKICGNETGRILVTLTTGDLPWSYTYRKSGGIEIQRNGIEIRTDTLYMSEAGKYELIELTDGTGCRRIHELPVFTVFSYEQPALGFGSSQSVCLDDTVSIRFEVTGGAGPWKVKVVDLRTGGIASELCGTDGLIFHGRDTVIRFAGVDTAEYSVNEVTDLGTGCGVQSLQDSVVKVIVNTPDHIEFTSGPWHVGQCRDANLLRDVLQPRLMSGNTLPSTVHFYVNGVDRGVSGILPQGELRGDSCYRVVCRYTDTEGCGVSSDEVLVCVDSLPSGAVVSSDVACESVATYFELQLRPAGRIDSVVIRQARYKKWDPIVNPVVIPKYTTTVYPKAQFADNDSLALSLNWDEVGGVDSCMTFEVLDIFDSHGCRMNHGISVREYDSLYRDTVWRHWDPVVDVEVRRSENRPWDRGVHEVNLPQGDSVQVRVTLVKGMPLWSLPSLGVDSIATLDTVFWLKREGIYYFQPEDLACGRQSTVPPYDLTVTQLDTGYFRGRLLLEGPYDEENGNMSQGNCNAFRLNDSLNLPSHLPLLPSHLSVIDWIEVELRVGSNIDSVALMTDSSFLLTRDTCLLLSDGHLADRLTGDTIVGIRNAYGSGSNRRYVAVRHRNHLGVMTVRTYPFVKKINRSSAAYIDFTDTLNIYYKATVDGRPNLMSYHMTKLQKNGQLLWLLSAGELNTNYLVTMHDPNQVAWDDMLPTLSSERVMGYRYDLLHDINLDGCVDWPGWNGTALTDWLFVQRNRHKYTEVRWR